MLSVSIYKKVVSKKIECAKGKGYGYSRLHP
jgi:hypothetical protein